MLQALFTSPILSIDTLHPGYEDHAFRKGYETIMPLPNLEQCRAPYRYLIYIDYYPFKEMWI
ncbi:MULTISPECIES: hypothetical protein [Bacillus]|uniref:hypothetical protein n=1 Tax=Bacillus TaxID=1386 RepID=UPI00032F8D4D|nr:MULTISPECIES: hypothetical protein [Bacillus cereus group]EOP55027.1 hypothetical protein IIW_01161 [Bacillus cereus VD136]EOP73086.1 hypothetical protein KOW_00496 [Bacillus cereus VDM006]EOQ09220.1 hypothetical protein KOY_03189 [Bacillus cereus VDM021]OOG93621.1 hypothetical protein BTH41_03614 [Bacillus mycoides]MDF2083838.1 hypothetical protein [Bacillus pseudomycoides]